MENLKQRKAFTVVEMVIVIAVIAILATVLIPTVSGVIQKANHSADLQFAASLNIQLAIWEVDYGTIDGENDLRNAINKYYGNEFYENLSPKSGKNGYHYWYNVADKQVVLAKYEDLLPEDNVAPAAAGATFATASPRCMEIGGKEYFLMDQGGSELADVISGLETLPNPEEYEALIQELDELIVDEDNAEHKALAAISDRIKVTTIVTDGGAFRYDAVADIEHIWVSPKATMLQQTKVYVYNGTVVDDGQNSDVLASESVTDIDLPSGVVVSLGGLPAIKVDPYNADETTRDYANTTRLHVNTTAEEDLLKIFTDCVLVMPNGSRYVWLGDQLYSLPVTIGESEAVGSVDSDAMSGIDAFDITCGEVSANPLEGKVYLYNDTLYVAYDKGGVKLSLTDNVTNGMVNWSSDNEALATVDGNGNVTIVALPEVVAGADYEVTITATYKYDTTVKATVTVAVVRPVSADASVGASNVTLNNDTDKGSVNISYDGSNLEHTITLNDDDVENNYEYVVLENGTLAYQYEGDLFTVENNVLKLNESAISGTKTQDLTIRYVGASGTVYFEKTVTVTVVDDSAVGLKKNDIATGVTMGETYLFRVGNKNAFTLGKLFSAKIEGKEVVVKGVTIYDAADTGENGNRGSSIIGRTGFGATYTANANWAASTIQFNNNSTGVAIIVVETTKGNVELAVEVVNGKNVTSAGDFSDATNYVVLNDITWGSSKDVAISGTIYGNGFAINAPNYKPVVSGNTAMFKLSGTIDNLVINGPVYPELSYSGDTYYIAGIYATGDAKITNSYISGFREPIMANSTSLYLENTTLVGGNYANLWLQTGSLTLKDVTTVQEKTAPTIGTSSDKVLGAGIIVNEGISNTCEITIEGYLNQYNWVTSADQSYLDKDIRPFVNVMFNDSSLYHAVTVSGEEARYINTGILFVGTRTKAVNDYRTNKTSIPYGVKNISTGSIYTYLPSKGSVGSINTYSAYTPNTQLPLKPEFKHNLTLQNGAINIAIDVPNKETKTLNVSGYTVSKYTNQNIAVNISCDGAEVNGNEITFSKVGTYTITYTVTDNSFYNIDGTRNNSAIVHTYTIKVVVKNTNHPDASINVDGVNKTGTWERSGWILDYDYADKYNVLTGLVITDYNEDGTSFTVTLSASNLNGLSITCSNSEYGQKVESSKYYVYDTKPDDNKSNKSITVTYSYTGKNGTTVTKSSTFSISK